MTVKEVQNEWYTDGKRDNCVLRGKDRGCNEKGEKGMATAMKKYGESAVKGIISKAAKCGKNANLVENVVIVICKGRIYCEEDKNKEMNGCKQNFGREEESGRGRLLVSYKT